MDLSIEEKNLVPNTDTIQNYHKKLNILWYYHHKMYYK